MSADDIVLTFPFTDEIRTRFNNALSEYEKLQKINGWKTYSIY